MNIQLRGIKKRTLVVTVVNLLLIIAVLAIQVLSGTLKTSLKSQTLVKRWSISGDYGQVSVFLSDTNPLSEDELYNIRNSISATMEDEGLEAKSEDAVLWIDAYSLDDYITVTREDYTVDSMVTAVGGDFFVFQPLELLTGSYFWKNDINDDLVILDETLSWKLFGSSSVIGMTVEINGEPFIISGVCRYEDDFACKAAYGELPRIYMSYSAYTKLDSSDGSAASDSLTGEDVDTTEPDSVGVTLYQVLMPNPVDHYAYSTLSDIFEGLDKSYSIIENSDRYSVPNLFSIFGDFGKRSMNLQGISYPYWENAAQVTENYAALLLLISIILLICPVISVILLAFRLWRNRKWNFKELGAFFMEKAKGLIKKYQEERLHK